MNQLYRYLDQVSLGIRLTKQDKQRLLVLFEKMYSLLDSESFPQDFKLATGIKARGATGRIALNAYLLLLARKAFGKNYTNRDDRLFYWAMYLGYHIMRSNFQGWHEKGIYCCPTCTLSVFPLYCVDAFRGFDSELLKKNVIKAYKKNKSVFSRRYNKGYAEWAMRFA